MAHKNSFSIVDSLSYGWKTFKANWQFLVSVALVTFLVNLIPRQLSGWAEGELPGFTFLFSIMGALANLVVSIGSTVILLKLVDQKIPRFDDLWKHYSLMLNYFLASALMGLIIFAGIILLIVPGLYFAVKYHFMMYFVVDKKMGPLEALRASGKITEGVKWKIVGLVLASAGVMILGALALGIGILVAIPVIGLADVYVYRKLLNAHHAE